MKIKHDRLYDSPRWKHSREIFLSKNPLCAICEKMGKVTPAFVVDHKKPHKGNVELFWSEDNWQSLCKPCHDSVKKMQEIHGYSQGCGVDGFPLDDNHPWGKNGAK